ncbi:MAG: hypothetical protein ACQET5_02500 [Halobacteriota archaeon]|uniref:hypothetical protein n=1 Tax=Natronomonas sp. TaxID=2184060 RepID=UPI003976B008
MNGDRGADDSDDRSTVPLSGTTLIVGPSGVGKTRRTARALEAWLDTRGPAGVVVLEFGPSIVRDGDIVGGRIDRFVDVPEDVWHGVLEAHAPRLQGSDEAEVRALARRNAERARGILDSIPPDPTAVFVNDATIPFQHESGEPDVLVRYCDRADCAVVNAYEGDGFGTDGAVSRRERAVLKRLRTWADRVLRLE